MPLLTISIASWNTKDLTKQTIESILANTKSKDFEIVVIDNASTDGSVEMIKEQFPAVKLIQNSENIGFGKAHNKVIKATNSKYVLILNSDVIVTKDAFDKMIDFMENNPHADVVTCKFLNPDMSLQKSIVVFPELNLELLTRLPYFYKYFDLYDFDYDKFQQVESFVGACYIVRRSSMEKLGWFDESLFAYMEETDLFFRMKKEKMKLYYLPDVEIIHYGGASTKNWADKHIYYYTNLLQFYKKEYGNLVLFFVRLGVVISNFLTLCKFPIIKLLPDSKVKQLEMREMDLAFKLLKINLTQKIEI